MSRHLIALALVGLTSPAVASGACFMAVNGQVYHEGACELAVDGDDVWHIRQCTVDGSSGYWVHLVFQSDTKATGHWNKYYGASHAHAPLGELALDGTCWSNDGAAICFDTPLEQIASQRESGGVELRVISPC